MDGVEHEFHNTLKPRWGPENTLVHAAYAAHDRAIPSAPQTSEPLPMAIIRDLATERCDIRVSKFVPLRMVLSLIAFQRSESNVL